MVPPTPPRNADNEVVASADTNTDALPSYDGSSAKTLRLVMAVSTSPRPIARPSLEDAADHTETVAAADQAVAAMALLQCVTPLANFESAARTYYLANLLLLI